MKSLNEFTNAKGQFTPYDESFSKAEEKKAIKELKGKTFTWKFGSSVDKIIDFGTAKDLRKKYKLQTPANPMGYADNYVGLCVIVQREGHREMLVLDHNGAMNFITNYLSGDKHKQISK